MPSDGSCIEQCMFFINSIDLGMNICKLPALIKCERSSVVELHLAKVVVEGSNPFARSSLFPDVEA